METLREMSLSDPTAATLLALGVASYLIVGLVPFNFDFGRPWQMGIVWVTPINGTLNVLCFVPIGYLAARFAPEFPIVAGLVLCAALSLTVEVLQAFIPHRHPLVSDMILNALGGTLGAWAYVHLAMRGAASV